MALLGGGNTRVRATQHRAAPTNAADGNSGGAVHADARAVLRHWGQHPVHMVLLHGNPPDRAIA